MIESSSARSGTACRCIREPPRRHAERQDSLHRRWTRSGSVFLPLGKFAAAAQMRHRTSQTNQPCQVTALWVAAAIVADAPDIRLATAGFWLDGDTVVHLGSLARHAARSGCQAAAAMSRNSHTALPASLVFWDQATVLAISARAGSGIARTLGDMTAGNLRPRASQCR